MTLTPKTCLLAKKKTALALACVCLFCAFFAPIMMVTDILLDFTTDYGSAIIVSVMWFSMGSTMGYVVYRWAMTARLVVTEDKIDCDDIGSLAGFSTTWDNIEYVVVSKVRLTLFLKEASEPSTKLGQWVIAHNWIAPKLMDLSSFIDHWKSGELKQDFEQYAPQLFVEEGKLKPAAA